MTAMLFSRISIAVLFVARHADAMVWRHLPCNEKT
jgi:hypothetical protein